MMDILYIVGPEPVSKHGNRELRWSLRSVAKYARNLGRVVVAGYPPAWLSDEVVRVPVDDEPGRSKFLLIWRKFWAAVDAGAVQGEFLVSGDDHFYSRPVDLDATPFWYRRPGILRLEDMGAEDGGSSYHRHLAATREVLVRSGYPARDCASHCNFRVDLRDAPVVRELFDLARPEETERAFDLGSMFVNVRAMREHVPFTWCQDIKATCFAECHPETGQFSIGDKCFDDPAFLAYMEREFGTPCKFEKEET